MKSLGFGVKAFTHVTHTDGSKNLKFQVKSINYFFMHTTHYVDTYQRFLRRVRGHTLLHTSS